MRAVVVTFPGSNCDHDCVHVLREVVGVEARLVWHREAELGDADLVVLPGGFSYGDYLRPGAIARFSPIVEAVVRHAARGGLVLGICNGFQILCEAGMLPGALRRNDSLKFQSHDAHVRVETTDTAFTRAYRPGQVLRVPIAHAEGNYIADPTTLERLEGHGRVVFRYTTREGARGRGGNPNGSVNDIAGIVNTAGNVLGLMPHPERAAEGVLGSTDGLGMFESLVAHFARERVA